MRLETDRLVIRSIHHGDELIFAEMAKDGSLMQLGFDVNCSGWINNWIEEAEELTEKDDPRKNYIPCVLELKATGEVIGSVGTTYYEDTDKIGICYFLGAAFRKNGYITEALEVYLPFFFDHYRESEIMAVILDTNTPSWKVAEKSGFTLTEKKMYKDSDDEKEELYRFYTMRHRS